MKIKLVKLVGAIFTNLVFENVGFNQVLFEN